ncbi:hypothetical protein KDJ21_015615 [Metabacillus litoralis]|nr:hypothetical protein [Metabacillus litoralis]MCM3163860.1 hypothetical protein [Metabacillus litoralis]MCM3410627.1 hypothetical protein [Metabacillus litoralis]UHA58286.1 hypothetical protein KDJ21_015615 [Metabacillus litoralis]
MKIVIYKEELYEIFYTYTSGYIELKKLESEIDDIILVHHSEVSPLESSA